MNETIKKQLVVSTYPSEKYDFVNWNDDIPNIWKNVSNHQPDNEIDHRHLLILIIQYTIKRTHDNA